MPTANSRLNSILRLRQRFSSRFTLRPTATFFETSPPRPRSFAQLNSSLLFSSRPTPRPQLPFLHPSSSSRRVVPLRTHLTRFISTERKARWKARLRWQLRLHAYFWPSALLVAVVAIGVQQTGFEHEYPTPRDWTFWSRWYLRSAQFTEFSEDAKVQRVLTDWQSAGYRYSKVLQRLEDEKYDGKFLRDQDDGGILVEGVGKTGFDITAKNAPWRRGYFQALMGAARVAEHLEGMAKLKDEENGYIYPRESILGPNNPRPKPLPWDKKGRYENPPKEDEVEDAYPAPEVFYMRILTTNGFDSGQRLEAALGYADWCDFKGLSDTATSMYDWALDIAAGGLPAGADNVVDIRTGVINKGKEEFVSQNLLTATTALAVHHARNKEVKQALPIFLSVLRARKSLAPRPAGVVEMLDEEKKKQLGLWDYVSALKDLFSDTPYPPLPSSGDERPYHTLKEACEEVGLMTYIGEILFATSQSEREKGLSWTRDSVEAAEAVLWVMDEQNEQSGRERCRECLQTGLQNWKAMAKQMARQSVENEEAAEKASGWLGTGLGRGEKLKRAKKSVERWQEEEQQIELRRQKTLPLTQPLKPTASGWLSAL